jgi:ribonucleoside-diphosphate reductase alpha chain
MSITVVKRDGSREPYQQEKIQRQIANACKGIADVSPSMVEIRARGEFHDGITTDDLDEIIIKGAVSLIADEAYGHTNYQYVAGRVRVSTLRKKVYGTYQPPRLFDIVKRNVAANAYTTELLEWYTEAEWDQMEAMIDHEKDEDFAFSAIEQLLDKYLVRNRVTNELYETPQVRYIVAAATAFHKEDPKVRMRWVKDYYACASEGLFTLATPVLAGLGTRTKQFSSCVLLRSNDSLKSIFATGEVMADYASKRAGIGLEIGRLRPLGAPIRNGEIKHTGMVPFLKKWFGDLRSCSQGGIRNASATVYFPLWHHQFDDLIVLKNNQGTDETRVRQLDYGVVVGKLFWRRYKQQGNITFFDPNEVPDLYEAYYRNTAEFERLYHKYEKQAGLTKKVMPAVEVFEMLFLKERSDTGRYYIANIDNIQAQGPFDPEYHTIYQSNLCAEILLPTRSFERVEDEAGRIALCTLGSMNWGAFRHPEDMKRACRVLVRSLSNVLDYQDFLSIQSKLSNKELMPLGIGITNLAYWHAKRGYKYGESEALADVKRWIEHQTFFCIEASMELAKDRGPCTEFHKTRYAQGIFPWELRAKAVNELTDFTPSSELDWEGLRRNVVAHGMRNATVGAIAPVESSSVVVQSTNGIEMVMALITIKPSKGSFLPTVVPEYNKLKSKYQLMWDQPDCIEYLKTAAVLAAYIDQSISTNTFYNPKFFPSADPQKHLKVPTSLVANNLMQGTRWGIKTFYYSLINKDGVKHSDTPEPNVPTQVIEELEEDCEACKL